MPRFCQEEDALGVKAQRLMGGVRRVITHVDDEIELAGFEFAGKGGFDVRAEADLDVRKFAAKIAQDDRQAIGEYAFWSADAQWAARFVADGALALFHSGESLFGKGLKSTTGVREG